MLAETTKNTFSHALPRVQDTHAALLGMQVHTAAAAAAAEEEEEEEEEEEVQKDIAPSDCYAQC